MYKRQVEEMMTTTKSERTTRVIDFDQDVYKRQGGGSYAINGVPAGIEGLNPIDLIQNMVHTAMEKGGKDVYKRH